MSRYAVINKAGQIENLIEWDGVTQFDPGPGLTLRRAKASDTIEVVAPAPVSTDTRLDALLGAIGGATSIADLKARAAAADQATKTG
jgi:hypothetical protein